MQTKTALALTGLVASFAACAPPPRPPPAPIAPVAAPPPTRARWVFQSDDRLATAQLALGDGGRLLVGARGLREVSKGAGPGIEAAVVEIDDFEGVLADDQGRFVFVTPTGDTYTAGEPLGALAHAHRGPVHSASGDETFASITMGRAAVLGVTRDRRVLRSADQGASWQEVAYGGDPGPHGRPVAAVLDAKGNGLLLHLPQRVFVTHDDGATWAPIATPGIGAHSLLRDADDRLWLVGTRSRARLDGAALAPSDARPSPIERHRPPTGLDDDRSIRELGTLVCGTRSLHFGQVQITDRTGPGTLASVPFGSMPSKLVDHVELSVGATPPLLACNGSEVVFARPLDPSDEEVTRHTMVSRSHDGGATWAADAAVEGAVPREGDPAMVVGPDGWTYLPELCNNAGRENNACHPRQVRVANGARFEPLASGEEIVPRAFAFDREHDRVYVTAISGRGLDLYASPLGENAFTHVRTLAPSDGVAFGMSVDAAGMLRVLVGDPDAATWTLHRLPFGADPLPPTYLSMPAGALAFAGPRGLLIELGGGRGWETADGGDTWTRVGLPRELRGVACSEAGCLDENGLERVGWDLPALQGAEVVTAKATLPAPEVAVRSAVREVAPAPKRQETDLDLVCKPSGAASKIAVVSATEAVRLDLVDRRAEVRWAVLDRAADGKTSVMFGSKSATREAVLLPAAPKPPPKGPAAVIQTGARVLADGVVAARYRTTTDGGKKQLDVELAWWSALTGKSHRHELTQVPPFSVSSDHRVEGLARLVDGGLAYAPPTGGRVYFLGDDGKVETFPGPPGVELLERVGKSWIGLSSSKVDATIAWSRDGGAAWTSRAWALETTGRSALALVDGKPLLTYSRQGDEPEAVFSVAATPMPDPPAPELVRRGSEDMPCDARTPVRGASYDGQRAGQIRVRIDAPGRDGGPAATLAGRKRVTHLTADGGLCTSAGILSRRDAATGDPETVFVYPEAKGYSGWWFHRTPAPKDKTRKLVSGTPITCAIEPGR